MSDAQREYLSSLRKGVKTGPLSESHKESISAGRRASARCKGPGNGWPKGKPRGLLSEKRKQEISAQFKGVAKTAEHRAKIGNAQLGKIISEEQRDAIRRAWTPERRQSNAQHYNGGQLAEDFSLVLTPAGFVREHQVQWGKRVGEHFRLDFAHVEGKIAIELDGPHHCKEVQKEYDYLRDNVLKNMGWKIIRVKHE